jgi:Ni/Co efflux regulator RcnB
MKRLMLTALAATLAAAPLAAAPAFAQAPQSYQRGYDNDRGNDRDWGRDNDRNDRGDRYDRDGRYGRDNDRYDSRFDARRHNGYYLGNQWHFGQPSVTVVKYKNFRPGYKAWKRGDRLGYYNGRYREVNYRDHRLRQPPRGYHYVQSDNGEIILAAIATGLIAAIIASN